MKRIMAIAIMMMVFVAFNQMQAQEKPVSKKTDKSVQASAQGHFVDKNGDGVCDNHKGKSGKMTIGAGRNFVDKNNDGQCDNYPNCEPQRLMKRDGSGEGKGNGRGRGNCKGNGGGRGNGQGQGRGR